MIFQSEPCVIKHEHLFDDVSQALHRGADSYLKHPLHEIVDWQALVLNVLQDSFVRGLQMIGQV